MALLAFKGFPEHARERKGMSMSDTGDGQCYVLCLCTGASMSDTGDADDGRLTNENVPMPSPAHGVGGVHQMLET